MAKEAPMRFIGTIDSRGRVTIPIQLRRKLGWMKRLKVFLREVDGVIWIQRATDAQHAGGKRRR
jgi:bifunctional DNA-binding transcriptional regulator/antitoxin component of YhaV-PrlF toxin-antitoxin module